MTRAPQMPADASDAEAEIKTEDGFLSDTLLQRVSNQNTSSAPDSLSSSATKACALVDQVSASPNASACAGATAVCSATGSDEQHVNNEEEARYPVVVHFALRPLKLTIYREPKYQRLYKQLTKQHYLLMNKRRITRSDRAQLQELCKRLEQYHSERCEASWRAHWLSHSLSLSLFVLAIACTRTRAWQ